MSGKPQRLTKRQQRLADKSVINFPSGNLDLKRIDPITTNQTRAVKAYNSDQHIFLHGSAGTGKTFLSMYLALNEIADKRSQVRKLLVVRPAQPSKQIGFLPGDQKKKLEVYEAAYKGICSELYGRGDAYEILKNKGVLEFTSTAFLRGTTIDDTVVLLDEVQNCSFAEIWTVLTRLGTNSRVIICGDTKQDDLTSERFKEVSGIADIIRLFNALPSGSLIQFTTDDIVRSGFVRELIITAEQLGL